jgi:Bacterial protein of unknown function (DUF885)
MSHRLIRRALTLVLPFGILVASLHAQPPPAPAAVSDQAPPKDLRPLLSPRQSEMRLVTTRYTLDRTTLAGNYLGGMRIRGARGGGPPAPPEPLSPNRIARIERFDLDWQVALAGLDRSALSPAGRAELETLEATVRSDLHQLDADAITLARLSPFIPFAPAVVRLVESRIRMDDLDPEKTAGTLTAMTNEIARVRAGLEKIAGGTSSNTIPVPKDLAVRVPLAVDQLRSSLGEWFTFYNGYDPLFTWWNGLPYKKADAALQAYAVLLREKIVPAEGTAQEAPATRAAAIAPAAPPKYPSVPDLRELIALPQDEMTDIVQRFRGPARTVRGVDAAPAGAPRDRAFYEGWLEALRTLDFDKLTRNAQVDYLYIKKTSEQQIARIGVTLPDNPPRKADASGIAGKARGRQGLIFDLQDELIPYTPEELIAIGDKEFAWCEAEMKKASRELGLGDDWKAALERMKGTHPPPGGQVGVIRELMFEAVDYLRTRDLLTVPAVAAESLHMIMMTPERQLVNPFFTGGTEISVSYPTDTMEYDARLQSMRGNNTPFSHATAFHEMIPGHNLVYYTSPRYRGYRPALGGNSPFYGEGWPLYWELTMYDIGFHDTPEKRIGALFWRMHRCARIIFSLRFHMGDWSPQECVDFLVDRVGFERENAIGEVRRSFQGDYAPLYQAAYLLGGLQLRGLRKEVVDSGAMPQKVFHDEILRQGSMPISLLRLVFSRQKLTRDMAIDWKFYGEAPKQ